MQLLHRLAFFIMIILIGCSCGNVKNLQYVQGDFDTVQLSKIQFQEPVIQKGDLLSISVLSDDLLATSSVVPQSTPANSASPTLGANPSSPTGGNGNGTDVSGFLVDQQGNIQMYKLGVIHAEGKTRKELADTITSLYEKKELLKNPFTEVRLLNYKITLIGEITHPGSYPIPNGQISIFEALGLAGDITVFGRRDNVLIVREADGKRQFGRVDLSKPDVFKSPFYYLQQNDMVIVDVGKNKSALNNPATVRNITVAASVLSVIAIFVNVFRR